MQSLNRHQNHVSVRVLRGFDLLVLDLASAVVGGAFAVVGFFNFVAWFGHDILVKSNGSQIQNTSKRELRRRRLDKPDSCFNKRKRNVFRKIQNREPALSWARITAVRPSQKGFSCQSPVLRVSSAFTCCSFRPIRPKFLWFARYQSREHIARHRPAVRHRSLRSTRLRPHWRLRCRVAVPIVRR